MGREGVREKGVKDRVSGLVWPLWIAQFKIKGMAKAGHFLALNPATNGALAVEAQR